MKRFISFAGLLGILTQTAPLFCNRVWRDDQMVMTYMAGSKTGIRFQIMED